MAKTNVPQNSASCQEDSNNISGSLFQSYREADVLHKLLAVEVFDGGNDRAADILLLCGFHKLIGGTNFASLGDAAEFYGVELNYVKTAMRRYGIGQKDLPEDVFTGWCYDLLMRFGREVKARHTVLKHKVPGEFVLRDNFTKRPLTVKGDYDRRTTYLSARLILMLPCFLYYGRKIPADSTVNTVFETLQRTSFFEKAEKRKREICKRRDEEALYAKAVQSRQVPADLPYDPDSILTVRTNGDIIMSGDVFGRLLDSRSKGAWEVMDALPEVLKQVFTSVIERARLVVEPDVQLAAEVPDMPTKQKRGGLLKPLSKPGNWDQVVDDVKKGRMTQAAGAKAAGMTYSSFRKYYKCGFRTE